MEVRTITNPDGTTTKHFVAEPGEHVLMTGPISGIKTLADGSSIDVTPEYIVVRDQAHADAVNKAIGMHHVENGHPHDVDHLVHPETGETVPVQRPFVFVDDAGKAHVGVGTPHGLHELDEANGITTDHADPRALAAARKKG